MRAQRWLILGLTVLFAAAALAIALNQAKQYRAEASLSFRDITEDVNLLGGTGVGQSGPQIAAANAELVTRPEVARRVKRSLGTSLSADELRGMVAGEVSARTNFVLVQATSEDPQFAADVATAFARATQRKADRKLRARLGTAIGSLRRRRRLSADPDVHNLVDSQLNQLITLQKLARPVELTRPAEVPTAAISPNPVRNAILGGLIGLALGLLAAFLRDVLDRRLRGTQDVHDALELPVLGRVSDQALGFDLSDRQNGAVAEPDLESFKVLRTNLEFMRAEGRLRSVLVTSGLPEEGKSTVAMALAATSVLAGRRTLLIECDLRRPSLGGRLGIEREPGLTDYLVGRAEPEDVLQTVELTKLEEGANGDRASSAQSALATSPLVCITAGAPAPYPAELLGSKRFRDLLAGVSQAYEAVIIDSSPFLSVADTLELIPQVDGVLVCVRVAQTTRDQARAARDALAHLPSRPTGVVVTGLAPGDESYGYYYHAYGTTS